MSVQRERPPHVYFMRGVGGVGPIKIGCSGAPIQRLQQIGDWAPYPLEILVTTPGDETLERRFHARHLSVRVHREWFGASQALLSDIKLLKAGAFDFDGLPEPRGLPSRRVGNGWRPETRLAVLFTRARQRVLDAGKEIPEDVRLAGNRYGAGRYSKYYDPEKQHDPADAKLLRAFVQANPPKGRR